MGGSGAHFPLHTMLFLQNEHAVPFLRQKHPTLGFGESNVDRILSLVETAQTDVSRPVFSSASTNTETLRSLKAKPTQQGSEREDCWFEPSV